MQWSCFEYTLLNVPSLCMELGQQILSCRSVEEFMKADFKIMSLIFESFDDGAMLQCFSAEFCRSQPASP